MIQDSNMPLNYTRLAKSTHLGGRKKVYVEECSRAMETNGNYLGMELLAPKNIFLRLTVDISNFRRIC